MKKFKKTYIEITNVCNLSCDFCPKTGRLAQFMSKELFESILVQMNDRSRYIYFHVMGEPLLHPDIGLFLDLCHKYGQRVNITTNGTLIDKVGESIRLKPALRQMNFSLHSFEANSNQYPMASYLDKIFEFIHKARKDSNLQICLRLWNLEQEGNNKENKDILNRIQKEFDLDYSIVEKLSPCNGIKLVENVFLNQAAKFDWPDIKIEDLEEDGVCYGIRKQLAFLVDGTVVPCCLDSEGNINLGNIKEQDLESILQSKRARALLEGFQNRKMIEPLCRKCGYRSRFEL